MVSKNLLLAGILFCSSLFAAVDVEVTPKESNGSPIVVRFTIRNEEGSPDIVKIPESNSDWSISPPFTQSSKSVQMQGLKISSQTTTTVSFFLNPLKVGSLKVPTFQIKLNERIYSTPETVVRVTKLNQQKGSKGQGIPGFPMFSLDDEDLIAPENEPGSENKRLDVAIVAEPSKVQVYTGELIVLPFYIYTNENIFRNLEFASFPTFKDFIKEELYLPKNWRTERVKYRGENYYRAEIIRFAIFPLKEGELLIDPLNMRFEIDDSLFSLRKHFRGQDQGKDGNSFLRSSGSIPVVVKPLPPKPVHVTQEVVAVGKYALKIMQPSVELVQNEPFSIKLRVEGRGNIKGIPEPTLALPEGIQKSKTATDYQIDTMSEGYKDFDLLLVPRKSGVITIPQSTWHYFDPDKKTYEAVTIPPIELRVLPSNKSSSTGASQKVTKDIVYSGTQDFEKEGDAELPIWAWLFPVMLYAFAGVLFVQRRRHEKEEALLLSKPWIKVERKIYAQHDLTSNEALGLVEEWILQRFKTLNMEEAAFEDLADKLSRKVAPSVASKVDKLKEKFRQIESARFGTTRKTNKLNLSFEEIKKLTEEIVESSLSYMAAPQISEDDDDD